MGQIKQLLQLRTNKSDIKMKTPGYKNKALQSLGFYDKFIK